MLHLALQYIRNFVSCKDIFKTIMKNIVFEVKYHVFFINFFSFCTNSVRYSDVNHNMFVVFTKGVLHINDCWITLKWQNLLKSVYHVSACGHDKVKRTEYVEDIKRERCRCQTQVSSECS